MYKGDDNMKKFLAICLTSIITVVVMYILSLFDNYNFSSYTSGMIVGVIIILLDCLIKD